MNGICVTIAVAVAAIAANANAAAWVVTTRVERAAWVVNEGPGCACGPTCDCAPCQCGLVREVSLAAPCAGGTCEVGAPCSGPPTAAAHHGGHGHSHGVGGVVYRSGQPLRNAGRLTVGVGRAVVRGAARAATVRYRARQNHGGPFPLLRAWRCRRCG